MKRYCTAILSLLLMASFRTEPKRIVMLGKEAPAFSLTATDGRIVQLHDFDSAKGLIVVFTCNHCPFARLYTDRFNALADRYTPLKVPLIAINPMDSLLYETETLEGMRVFAASMQYHFSYLQDRTQQVAAAFHATHTPQVFVLWRENSKWIIRYQGAIDNNGQHPELAAPFVAQAVDALLRGDTIAQPERLSLGCEINYRK
ncbi:thioredoxin family protein [Rurimicrobium arvi]